MLAAKRVTGGKLGQLHGELSSVLSELVRPQAVVEQSDEMLDWTSALPGTTVRFGAKPATRASTVGFWNERDQRGQRVLFRFDDANDIVPLWVSWSEEWVKSPPVAGARRPLATLDFVGMSLCCYAGLKEKTQLIRADWDNQEKRGREAAQPHWHIDRNLIDLPAWSQHPQPMESEALQELPPEGVPLLSPEPGLWSLQRLHLGMGGWSHPGASFACWQHQLDLSAAPHWLRRVLEHCRKELPQVTSA
jgi:hypothetical protein